MDAKQRLQKLSEGEALPREVEITICLVNEKGGATLTTNKKKRELSPDEYKEYRNNYKGISIDLNDYLKGSS